MVPGVAACVALVVAVPSAAQESTAPGRIEGKLTDRRCGTPVPYSNLILLGTNMGSMTVADGLYSILNIPPGTYTIRVMSFIHDSVDITDVRVQAGATVRRDVVLETRNQGARFIDDCDGAGECKVHYREMVCALVPVVHGLRMVDPEYEAVKETDFPHAEPWFDEGCVVGGVNEWRATVYLCPDCVTARNRYKDSDVWDRAVTSQRALQMHRLADAIEFGVPRNAETQRASEACRETLILKADSVTVRVVKGDWIDLAGEYPREVVRDAVVIQDGATAQVAISESGDGFDVYVRFAVTTVDSDAVIMRIQAKGDEGLRLAAAIVRSVKFSAF
jgi:hypothetical protein